MKLTTTIRDAFVNAAMADVPTEEFREQRQRLLQDEARDKLPPKVRAIYDDSELRGFLSTKYIEGCYIYTTSDFRPSATLLKKMQALDEKREAQNSRNSDLRNKLRAVALSCTTRKALADALPEFEKYLPADAAAASRMVPVVANVVSDFVKAGWPKGKKPAVKSAKATA